MPIPKPAIKDLKSEFAKRIAREHSIKQDPKHTSSPAITAATIISGTTIITSLQTREAKPLKKEDDERTRTMINFNIQPIIKNN